MASKSRDNEQDVGYTQAKIDRITRKIGLSAEYILPQQDVRLYIPYLPGDMFDIKGLRQSAVNMMKILNMITWYFNLGISYSGGKIFSGFVINYRMNVDKTFYTSEKLKYPLLLEGTTDYVKRSSRRCSTRLATVGHKQHIASASWTSINMDMNTKRPSPFPEEWKQKHCFPKDGPILDIRWPSNPKSGVVKNAYKILFSHLDENNHTNFTTYVTMCLDSFYENIVEQLYPNSSAAFLDGWIETIEIEFKGDSQLHDHLTISSWQDSKRNEKFYFEIERNSKIITLLSFKFYSSFIENSRL